MKHHWILLIALAGLLLVIGPLISMNNQRGTQLTETGETRRVVLDSLDRFLPANAASAEEESVLAAARSLSGAPFVARLWVIDNRGKIVYHDGGPGKVGDEVRALSGRDGRALIAALSSDEFSGAQAMQMYTVMALMVEGEHNDVYRPLVRSIKNADGRQVGLVGISYDVSTAVSSRTADQAGQTALLLFGLACYWLALPAWTFLDARRRGAPAIRWGALVLVANLAGLLAYVLVMTRGKK